MPDLIASAAANNAAWCASVCFSHGIGTQVSNGFWATLTQAPALYPDAVTLTPDVDPVALLAVLDGRADCGIKDSFDVLNLQPFGFRPLLSARWIHRGPPGTGRCEQPATGRGEQPGTRPPPDVHAVTDADGLARFVTAWCGDDLRTPPDVFRLGLLSDPDVRLVLVHRPGQQVIGGAALNLAAGVVGVSNVFGDAAVWPAIVAAAAAWWPGTALVGYEQDDDLPPALAAGFADVGPLTVWVR